MANFQKAPNDKTTRFDTGVGRLVLMLEETAKIDLFGGGPNGERLVVDLNDPNIGTVSDGPVTLSGWLSTYEVTGLKAGNAMLEARVFNQTPANHAARRALWFSMPVYAFIQVSVMGAEYRQAGSSWGNLEYGSMNPAWRNVKWTNMAQAGCGPTSLAIIMDFLHRLGSIDRGIPASFPGISPLETMDYTSKHGRAADAKGEPSGTSGPVMMSNLSSYWPGYVGESVPTVDKAIALLREGHPLVFLCNKCITYKYDSKGQKQTKNWPGHFMVLLGVEHSNDTFWITDPSLAHHKYISRDQLSTCNIWHVYRQSN